jgi:glycerol-1-phosphate dehydrogenase [NAD(P)+]
MRDFAAAIRPWLGAATCPCGGRHEVSLRHVVIAAGALEQVPAWLRANAPGRALIVGDARTLEAAGQRLEAILAAGGAAADVCGIADNAQGEVVADEDSVVQALLALRPETRVVVAVGSGTLHDIVRFACHRTGRAIVSAPTAPSVDGFASTGAPLVLRGFKQTIPACTPEAIFADLDVLAAAPPAMIAAGFGDLLGKFTSLADWRLGQLLLNEAFCERAANTTMAGLQLCLDNVEEIAAHSAAGVGLLMEGLLLSGIAMLMVGNSRPASGSEHHLSHFWEMRYLQEGRRAELHGAKVGVACVLMARLYASVASMSEDDAIARLERSARPSRAEEAARIRGAFGSIAPQVLRENGLEGDAVTPSVSLTADGWAQVRRIAASVPAPERLAGWLRDVGAPATPADIGLPNALVQESLKSAMYVRNRFTVMRLARLLEL